MRKKDRPAAKPWVHLTSDEKPFDQTNGAVDFDVEDAQPERDAAGNLIAKGVASNTVNVGFFGGGMG